MYIDQIKFLKNYENQTQISQHSRANKIKITFETSNIKLRFLGTSRLLN